MTLDFEKLTAVFAADDRIVLAVLFGSSQYGNVRAGGDVDIGVLFAKPFAPEEFFQFYLELSGKLPEIAELDLTDLGQAGSILAFEALRGRILFVRNRETAAAFASRVAREYEDDRLHAARRKVESRNA